MAARSVRSSGLEEGRTPGSASGLAIFDLDRTLYQGTSLVPFGRELVRRRFISKRMLARHLWDARTFTKKGEQHGTVSTLCEELLAVAEGREAAPLAEIATEVGTEIGEHLHPTARWLVDQHLDRGDFVVIVSASIHELVEGVARAIGVHRGVGTKAEVVDGILTGRLVGPVCHGAGKLVRLRAEVGAVDLSSASAYADSESDLPLLAAVGTPVAVNPDKSLVAMADGEGWPSVSF